MTVLRWLVHVTGSDYGGPAGHLVPYSFWSGIAGSFAVSIVIWFGAFYAHKTCHTWWCPRVGRYPFTDERTQVTYRLCAKCHPAHSGKRLTRRRIADIHASNKGDLLEP